MRGNKVPKVVDPRYKRTVQILTPVIEAVLKDPEFQAMTEDEQFTAMILSIQATVELIIAKMKMSGKRFPPAYEKNLLIMLGWVAGKKGWLEELLKH